MNERLTTLLDTTHTSHDPHCCQTPLKATTQTKAHQSMFTLRRKIASLTPPSAPFWWGGNKHGYFYIAWVTMHVLLCWCVGVLACCCVAVLACWRVGVLLCWCVAVLVCFCVGVLLCCTVPCLICCSSMITDI